MREEGVIRMWILLRSNRPEKDKEYQHFIRDRVKPGCLETRKANEWEPQEKYKCENTVTVICSYIVPVMLIKHYLGYFQAYQYF